MGVLFDLPDQNEPTTPKALTRKPKITPMLAAMTLASAVPGFDANLVTRTGLESVVPPEGITFASAEEARDHWMIQAAGWLRERIELSSVALGLLLEEMYDKEVWRGRAESWAEFVSQVGLDEARASKLRTIARTLILDAGLDPIAVAAIKDETKTYEMATRGKKLLAAAKTPEAREAAITKMQTVLDEDANALSRSDLRRAMDDKGIPRSGNCRHLRTVTTCELTGEPDPRGCDACGGIPESASGLV